MTLSDWHVGLVSVYHTAHSRGTLEYVGNRVSVKAKQSE